jgi:type I restriction enzyme S subunit
MKDNWITKQILEFGDVISGGTPSTTVDEFWGGEIVWITPADLSKKQFPEINTSRKKITLQGLNSSSANLIPANSIVMSSRAPIGYFAVPSVDFSTNQGCKSIKLHNGEDSLFHYYNFLFNVEVFKRRGEGTTFAEISKKEVEKLSFSFPELLREQQKIAKILSTVDNVIENTENAIAKYQAIKQGLMHDLFTRGIDVNTGKLRPTPQEAPELYKESVLGLIPKEWEEITFGDEINFLSGFPFASVFFNEEKKGKPLIRIRDLLNSSQETYYNGAFSDSYLIKEGDVLIGMDGDFHIVKWKNSASLLNQRILKISEKKDGKLYLDYFFYYLFPFLLDVHNKTAATTVKHLSTKDISGTTRFMPLKSEQILSAKKILSIDDKIQTEQEALAKYQQLKAGLLQDLLTGKVEVLV